jgi:hypothetical protein
MEYSGVIEGYYAYKNVKNTQTNKQLTLDDLVKILKNNNIDYRENGINIMVKAPQLLKIEGGSSIILKKCDYCDIGSLTFVYDYVYENCFGDVPCPPQKPVIKVNIYPYSLTGPPSGPDRANQNDIKSIKIL